MRARCSGAQEVRMAQSLALPNAFSSTLYFAELCSAPARRLFESYCRSVTIKTTTGLRFLQDLWDPGVARGLDEPELLRYRSNLLGADLRITNFGGGNTSSK